MENNTSNANNGLSGSALLQSQWSFDSMMFATQLVPRESPERLFELGPNQTLPGLKQLVTIWNQGRSIIKPDSESWTEMAPVTTDPNCDTSKESVLPLSVLVAVRLNDYCSSAGHPLQFAHDFTGRKLPCLTMYCFVKRWEDSQISSWSKLTQWERVCKSQCQRNWFRVTRNSDVVPIFILPLINHTKMRQSGWSSLKVPDVLCDPKPVGFILFFDQDGELFLVPTAQALGYEVKRREYILQKQERTTEGRKWVLYSWEEAFTRFKIWLQKFNITQSVNMDDARQASSLTCPESLIHECIMKQWCLSDDLGASKLLKAAVQYGPMHDILTSRSGC